MEFIPVMHGKAKLSALITLVFSVRHFFDFFFSGMFDEPKIQKNNNLL